MIMIKSDTELLNGFHFYDSEALFAEFIYKKYIKEVLWFLFFDWKSIHPIGSWRQCKIKSCDSSGVIPILLKLYVLLLVLFTNSMKLQINFLMIFTQHCSCPFVSPLLCSIEGNTYAGCRFSLWISTWAENLPPIWFAHP